MASLQALLAAAREALVRAGIPAAEAALDAEVLARHLLGWDRAGILTRWRDPAPPGFSEQLRPLLARRLAREPVAYITGHREFWGLELEVTPDVLIPRPETERIVEAALECAHSDSAPRALVDVGTGSGCLAIALATEFPAASVIATDISPAALTVAARNARRHGVADRITLLAADLLDSRVQGADLIVSNPPYIPDADAPGLQPEVGGHEPASALFGGPGDGLGVLRRLLSVAPPCLAPGGRLIVEFGFGQEAGVRAAASAAGWEVVRVGRDLQQIPRIAVMRR